MRTFFGRREAWRDLRNVESGTKASYHGIVFDRFTMRSSSGMSEILVNPCIWLASESMDEIPTFDVHLPNDRFTPIIIHRRSSERCWSDEKLQGFVECWEYRYRSHHERNESTTTSSSALKG